MLITNGKITRNIADKRLAEYTAKGYKEVKTEEKPKGKKPKDDKTEE